MKIYTRTGDRGTTALFGGDRVAKSHPRLAAYGTVDELNSVMGQARALLQGAPGEDRLAPLLDEVQQTLFVVGADLATPSDARPFVPRVATAHVDGLEAAIDAFDGELPPLKQFILPGGTPGAATLHVARTVCRRAERLTVDAAAQEPINEHAVIYLNRLSDLLFVLARWANRQAEQPEATWDPDAS